MSELTSTDTILSRLGDLLALSHVPRWATHPVTRPQTVDSHCYRVAVLAMAIRDALSENARLHHPGVDEAALLRWALIHDGPEAKTGDIPRPVKRLMGEDSLDALEIDACQWFKRANPGGVEEFIVKIADAMEALTWISSYGHGFRDRFDNHDIEFGFRKYIHQAAVDLESALPTGREAVLCVLAKVAP